MTPGDGFVNAACSYPVTQQSSNLEFHFQQTYPSVSTEGSSALLDDWPCFKFENRKDVLKQLGVGRFAGGVLVGPGSLLNTFLV